MGKRQHISEDRIQTQMALFERWLRQGPDKSQVTFSRHNGSVWCKGIEYNGPAEEVLRTMGESREGD